MTSLPGMLPILGVPVTRAADYCLGIPAVWALALSRALVRTRRRGMPRAPKRIGVLCSPTMGDTVLLSAVLLDVRAHFGPEAEIVHFCGAKNILAAELLAGASRRVVLNLLTPIAAARRMRAEKLDLLLDFSAWQRITAALAMLSGSRYTVGFRSSGQQRHHGYDLTVAHRADQHELDNFRDLARAAGIPTLAEPAIAADSVELDTPWQDDVDLIVLHPWPAGGPGSMREWPREHWVETVRALNRPGRVFAITGSPAERARSEALAEYLRTAAQAAVEPFTGGQGLRQIATLLCKSRLAICVNTGVMHLAAAAGAPTVSLNGPTAGHRWGPRGRCCTGIAPSDGSGGYLHFGFEFHARMPDVMPRILPEQVIAAARELLARCSSEEVADPSR